MNKYDRQLSEEIQRSHRGKTDSFTLSDDKSHLQPSYGSLLGEDVGPGMEMKKTSSQEWQKAVSDVEQIVNNRNTIMQENGYRQEQYKKRSGRSTRSDPYASIIGHGALARQFMNAMILVVICYTIIILFGSLIITETMSKSQWCPTYSEETDPYSNSALQNIYENPDHNNDPCHYERLPFLLYLTMEEADCCRRMLLSVIMGGAIGYERRSSDRPAGVRTMGLVSLGACFFTISSQLAFKSSTMGWDASRVTAAIPSGCGFLGAGLIWKGTVGTGRKDERHEVHGLTTAAGVWLSAAIGTGCGGKLYFVSGYSCILVTTILRYGPKIYFQETGDEDDDDDEEEDDDITDDDGGMGDEEDENDSNQSNCTSQEMIQKKDRLPNHKSNATKTRTKASMEGVRVALVDADELEMFEAWKREREQVLVDASARNKPSRAGMAGSSRVGFDSCCSEPSSLQDDNP